MTIEEPPGDLSQDVDLSLIVEFEKLIDEGDKSGVAESFDPTTYLDDLRARIGSNVVRTPLECR
jgi:hypothetical protein